MTQKKLTLQELVEAIEELELEEQEILMEIFSKRLKEYRRKELIKAFEAARQNYANAEVEIISVADLLAELRNNK
ncbi:MAG: hypothetical protein F6K61_07035 [Sphaerospermopsis sp. SIO1G1]|nr:hypothetical protein [Sphaerospermopsis sp. SIO1G1]